MKKIKTLKFAEQAVPYYLEKLNNVPAPKIENFMAALAYPMLYQVNTRVWLTELSGQIGRPATLDDISDRELDKFVKTGFEWIWFLSVWQTGEEGRRLSRTNPEWLNDFHETLDDLKEEDIPGSGFAITGYTVHPQLGGGDALARLRKRLQDRGLKLMLDFVPNHAGPDHEWTKQFPDFFIHGNEALLAGEPGNYIKVKATTGDLILAHGRDPYYPGWPDTVQLNYNNPALQDAMTNELIKISGQCDGVRCDMAMLVLPEVFQRTWGLPSKPFWPEAIKKVKQHNPDFSFMAEVYWEMEWILQQQGFDYTYDKRLYDRLREGHAKPVREHLYADLDFQLKMVRFLENHDEPRAATAFPGEMHEAAAIITFLSPGLRFFHQGQLQGKKKRISPHLGRGPVEPVDEKIEKFYNKLLAVLRLPVFQTGNWKLLECVPAKDGSQSYENYICFAWESTGDNRKVLVVVNYASENSRCLVKLTFTDLVNKRWRFRDLFSDFGYEQDGDNLQSNGLYFDEPGWKYYAFALERL